MQSRLLASKAAPRPGVLVGSVFGSRARLLDVVVAERAAILAWLAPKRQRMGRRCGSRLQLLAREDQALLVGWDAFLSSSRAVTTLQAGTAM